MLRQQQQHEPVDGLDAPVHISPKSLFRKVYAFFHNKKVGLFLIFATGFLSLIGVLARQMPDSVRLDPASKAAWLEQVRPIYGGWTEVVDAVGIFHIFSSPLFLGVAVLLAVSIIACTTHRLPNIYRQSYRPRTGVRQSFFHHAKLAEEIESPLGVDETKAAVRQALRGRRYRVIEDPDGETLYSDRWHWAPFGTAAAHAGYVVVMAGFLVSSFAGFRIDNFELTVGLPREVGYGTGLTAQAESFQDSYDPATGTPIDYVADLVVSRDGEQIAHQDVRVNEPLVVDGIYFHQASFGVSAVVDVTDAAGETLFQGGVPLSWTTPDDTRQYGVVVLEDLDLELFVIANASGQTSPGLGAGQARVELYPVDSQTPIDMQTVDAGGSVAVGDVTVSFEREQRFTSLIVKKDPGTLVVWVGCALLIVGMTCTMALRHRRQWVRVMPAGAGSLVRVATTDKVDSIRRRNFETLAESISSAVGSGAVKGREP